MGAAQEAGRLRIGVPAASPPIGFVERRPPAGPADRADRTGGMATDLGRIVAEALHVRAELVPVSGDEEMLDLLDARALDLGFPEAPLTEARLRTYSFTNPYVVVHQRLLVRAGSGISEPADLAGRTTCSYLDPVTGVPPDALEPAAEVVAADSLAECADLFRRGRVDAVTADDVFLDYLAATGGAPGAEIVGDELTTSAYGAAVATGATSFATIVEDVLADAIAEGDWADIYTRWVGVEPGGPPELTAEEAAALYPMR
jgi:ABC-type amino acid transport substrate-binding protein